MERDLVERARHGRILYYHATTGESDGLAQVGTEGLWLMDADGSRQAPLSLTFPDLRSATNGSAFYGHWQPQP